MVAVTGFDEQYTVDNLNRLRDMKRGGGGRLNGSHVIPGTPPRQLTWTLDPTGNGAAYSEGTTGSTTLLQTRTASEVNEITDTTSYIRPFWATPAYDDAGNMTSGPKSGSRARPATGSAHSWPSMGLDGAARPTVTVAGARKTPRAAGDERRVLRRKGQPAAPSAG